MADIEVTQPDSEQDISMSNDVATSATSAPTETISPTPVDSRPAADSSPEIDAPVPAAVSEPVNKPVVSNRAARPWGWIVAAVLAVAVLALGWWVWQLKSDKNNLQKQLDAANTNPQAIIDKQTNQLIDQVGKLMNLPQGETPTVANVANATKAKASSAFFANAQNGDKVLLYVKAGEAILYRPSTNKIILVAPLTFANGSATNSGTTKQ